MDNEIKQEQHVSMAEVEEPSSGSVLCSINHPLQLPEATDQKEVVLHILQAARVQPAAVMPVLTVMLQQDDVSVWQKVAMYHSLRAMLEHGLEVGPVQDLILVASRQLRATSEQGVPRELQVAASSTLATFARHHFNPIMTELQRQLKPFTQPDEFLLLTLGKMAANNVYGCVPFLGITLTTLQTTMRRMEDGRRRRALCMGECCSKLDPLDGAGPKAAIYLLNNFAVWKGNGKCFFRVAPLEQICEAIRIYLRSWERSSHPRLRVQQFSTYLLPLYACITHTWLPGSDVQVKLAILKVLSPMLRILLTQREHQVQIHDDLSLLMAQYESNLEATHITKILGQILEASLVNNNPIPSMHVEPLACILTHQHKNVHPGALISLPKLNSSLQLARSHPSELMGFFQVKLDENEEDLRVVLLVLLSIIIGAQLPELWTRRQMCVKATKVVLSDNAIRVRFAMLQVIGKLLQAGYLEKVEGWPLNYISLQLAISARQLGCSTLSLPLGGLEEKAIQRASTDALQVAVASGRGTSQELWGKLLSYLMQPHLTGCATSLCHTLRLLAEQRMRRAVEDGLEAVDSPTPQELLARLLSLVVSPFEGSGRGTAVLLLLQALRLEIYKNVAKQWWVEVPALVHLLEGHSKYTLEQATWKHRLLEFLKKSLWRNQDGGWNLDLGHELAKQMGNYPSSSAEKEFLYKALGTALSTVGDMDGVMLHLQELLLSADYADEDQRESLCWCLAYCGEGQFPAILKALSHFEEEISKGEDSALLHFSQDLQQPGRGRVKSALLLLYSSATIRAPPDQLLLHLTADVLPKILHHFTTASWEGAKDPELILSFTRCVSEICLSIQGGGEAITFLLPHKRALVDHLMGILKTQPLDALMSPAPQKVMVALRHLRRVVPNLGYVYPPGYTPEHLEMHEKKLYNGGKSKVPEALSHEENRELIELCLAYLFALPPVELMNSASELLYTGTMASLAELVKSLLEEKEDREDAGSQRIQEAFQLLWYWLISEREWERARAMQLAARLLKEYHPRITASPKVSYGQYSHLVGTLGPFTYDTHGAIRQAAGDCIRTLLNIQGIITLQTPQGRRDDWKLHRILQDLHSECQREAHSASFQLAKMVSRTIPHEEVLTFMCSLMEQLGTVSVSCDRAAILWFEVMVGERDPDLRGKICDLVAFICASVQHSEDPAQCLSLARAMATLSKYHLKTVCASLLDQPLLQDRARKELWAALITRTESCASILKYLLRRLRAEGRAGEANGGGGLHGLVLSALQEVVVSLNGDAQLLPLLPELCHLLLIRLSRDPDAEAQAPALILERNENIVTPHRQTSGVLQAVFHKALPKVATELDLGDTWHLLAEPCSFLKGVAQLARALGCSAIPLLDGLLSLLLPSLNSSSAASRDLSLFFCAELTGHPLLHEPQMRQLLLHQLLTRSRDGDATTRLLAVRGLGNVAKCAPEEAKKQQKALLASLLEAAGEAASSEVVRESLLALNKVLGCLGGRRLGHTLQVVARQALLHLQQADAALRAAAFELIGHLAKVARTKRIRAFAKEVRDVSTALLLHLQDPSPAVAQACSTAFILCAPFLSLKDLSLGMDPELSMDTPGTQHFVLMDRICQQLSSGLWVGRAGSFLPSGDSLIFGHSQARMDPALLEVLTAEVPKYMCCPWEEIQIAACKLAGVLAENMDPQRLGQLDLRPLLQSLHSLCGDCCAALDVAAMEAINTIRQKRRVAEQQAKPGCWVGGHQQRPSLSGWSFC
ncbi:maestro heat-like repeat-containing protein family member 2A [Sphaerodactylus townsendi]|uniref:maestro heat-like repeat-containing protein family member 2A n=1 Tax=Sphaerodactylus townsendi TaxID=933632 RepID=UPI0020262303|nr:maestro heat-like repeat-containing protein family member 2A [Sphaerodactylus townsendi]